MSSTAPAIPARTQRRVLIVDDDAMNLALMEKVMVDAGYAVIVASDGLNALRLAREHRPDAMLLDVQMPEMSGFDVLAQLRVDARCSDIQVIIVSGIGESQGRLQGVEAGAADFVHKPFRPIELVHRVNKVLDLEEARRQLREAEVEFAALRATDPVTGLGNFQRLHAVLEYEFLRASRYQRPLSLAAVSDDGLEPLMSKLKRDFSEDVLRRVAALVRAQLRGVDRVFRIDAAEFVMILPETPIAGARIAIDRIVQAISDLPLDTGHTPHLVASIVSMPHPEIKRADDFFRALNLALSDARKARDEGAHVVEFSNF
jgi:diguanylate cyclase (GGDEF)-like protein